jgi:hypothetical protein
MKEAGDVDRTVEHQDDLGAVPAHAERLQLPFNEEKQRLRGVTLHPDRLTPLESPLPQKRTQLLHI